jgi:hypothetical protein
MNPNQKLESRVSIHKTATTTNKIKILFLLYTQLNAIMSQTRMGILLHAVILSFDNFEVCDGRIINALQCFKNLILVIRFFVNRYPETENLYFFP